MSESRARFVRHLDWRPPSPSWVHASRWERRGEGQEQGRGKWKVGETQGDNAGIECGRVQGKGFEGIVGSKKREYSNYLEDQIRGGIPWRCGYTEEGWRVGKESGLARVPNFTSFQPPKDPRENYNHFELEIPNLILTVNFLRSNFFVANNQPPKKIWSLMKSQTTHQRQDPKVLQISPNMDSKWPLSGRLTKPPPMSLCFQQFLPIWVNNRHRIIASIIDTKLLCLLAQIVRLLKSKRGNSLRGTRLGTSQPLTMRFL